VEVLHKLYEDDISIATSVKVFAALDLSRHAAPKILGREPFFFASLFMHAIVMDLASPDVSGAALQASSERIGAYCHWLNDVILASGVAVEVLEETWYQLICSPLGSQIK
jgi:hypothetical protein